MKGKFSATADDPLYLGTDGERPQTNAAIDQSRGWGLVLANRPLEAEFPVVPGDVTVFFADSSGYIGHMGLYIGGGRMVHAPQTGDVVKVTDISSGRYFERFAGGRRYSP